MLLIFISPHCCRCQGGMRMWRWRWRWLRVHLSLGPLSLCHTRLGQALKWANCVHFLIYRHNHHFINTNFSYFTCPLIKLPHAMHNGDNMLLFAHRATALQLAWRHQSSSWVTPCHPRAEKRRAENRGAMLGQERECTCRLTATTAWRLLVQVTSLAKCLSRSL